MKNVTVAVVLAAALAAMPLFSYAQQISVSVGGPGGVNVTSGYGPTNYERSYQPSSYYPQQQYSYGYQPQQYQQYSYGYNAYPNSHSGYYNTSNMPYYSSYPQYSSYQTGTYDGFGESLCQWSDYSGATECSQGDPQQWVQDVYTGMWY